MSGARKPSALISTVCSIGGGVSTMTRFIADLLHQGGIEPLVARYEPYSLRPGLSVPVFRLLSRRPGTEARRGCPYEERAIGAWLPELEFTHYLPTRHWRQLIDETDFHLTVSGNALAATPYALKGVPYWAWVATPWDEDRVQRADAFSAPRKALDRLVTAPGARLLQRRALRGGKVMALSRYTRERLRALAGGDAEIDVMPMGVDVQRFRPESTDQEGRTIRRIGFVGRLSDPRKNIELLMHTVKWWRTHCPERLELLLIGGGAGEARALAAASGVSDGITILDNVDNEELPSYLNTLDAFVIPSHQEGLCIAALEAMSCGVPVVSTRCGGPEEFVVDGETGFLSDADPQAYGRAIAAVVRDPETARRMGGNARRLVECRYSNEVVRATFWQSFEQTFGVAADQAVVHVSPAATPRAVN